MTDPRRGIPSVERLLQWPSIAALAEEAGRDRLVAAIRASLDAARRDADAGAPPPSDPGWYAERVRARLAREARPSLRRVINATGVVLHTNLGRAPLAEAARQAVAQAAGYSTLEYDLDTGARGSRHEHCVHLLRELTGAGAALVVNNNAAAVLLALNTLAAGREVVISRGELVEIGGSFRVPDIMARSGAIMREVGSTNRTHLADYRRALGARTGLLLKVHRSNFRLEGYTAEAEPAALAGLARKVGVPLMHDLGSGAVMDPVGLGLPPEPTARATLEAGATVVTMSGDKLLGGPQAGIVLGDPAALEPMRRNPLARALRPGKLTLAALEATLRLYRDPPRAAREVPVLRMLGADGAELEARAAGLAEALRARGIACDVVAAASAVGGGAYPGVELAGSAVAVEPGAAGAGAVAGRLRAGEPPVVARVREGRVVLDPRTVDPAEEAALVAAVAAAVAAP